MQNRVQRVLRIFGINYKNAIISSSVPNNNKIHKEVIEGDMKELLDPPKPSLWDILFK